MKEFFPMRHLIRSVILVPLLVLAACGSTSAGNGTGAVTLNVFAAASLQTAFTELGTDFQQTHAGVTVTFNFAGSQQLAQQLTQGAPADVFASANKMQMQGAIQGGDVADGSQQTFVKNRLIVITPTNNPAGLHTLQDLAKPGLKLVLADKTVPVGQYALTFLQIASTAATFGTSYQANVLKNVVSYEQDVKSVFIKVQLGEADAGIVYTSDVATNGSEVGEIVIPDALNVIATYPIAPVKSSSHTALANAFITLVLSPQGQAVLAKYGFIAVNAAALVSVPTVA